MKNGKKKFELALVAILLLGQMAFAQVERTKKIDRSYSGKTAVALIHKNGPVKVETSSDGKVHVHAELTVKAKTDEAAEAVFAHFDVDADEFGDRVEIKSSMGSYMAHVTNRASWIKFGMALKSKGCRNLKSA